MNTKKIENLIQYGIEFDNPPFTSNPDIEKIYSIEELIDDEAN